MAPPGLLFDHLESAAVQIGKRDRVPFLTRNGRLARVVDAVFGIALPAPLACRRLEALRTLVIALRRRRRSPRDAIETALTAGIRQSQVDHLFAELRPAPAAKAVTPLLDRARRHHVHAHRPLFPAGYLAALGHGRPHDLRAVLG